MAEIPRIIHQIWLGPLRRPQKLLDSVRVTHPGWDYRLWTEENLPALRKRDAFDRSPTWHQKSDVLRYELLWRFGGVYVDADSLALRPIDALVAGHELFAGYERGTAGLVATGVIGCTPRHPVLDRLIRELDVDRAGPAWDIVGPGFFTRTLENAEEDVTLYPGHYFYPIHHDSRLRLYLGLFRLDPRLSASYFVHYWGTTTAMYYPWPRRMARRLAFEIRRNRSRWTRWRANRVTRPCD